MSDTSSAGPTAADAAAYRNNYGSIIGLDAACVVITTGFMALRLYVRYFLVKKIGVDDWLLLVAAIMFNAACILDAVSWRLLQKDGIVAGWYMSILTGTIDVIPYLLAEAFARLAYAAFYLRVIPPELNLRWHRWIIIVTVSLYFLFQFTFAFIYLFACGSPANLGSTRADVKCISDNILNDLFDVGYYADAMLDWLMALIPATVIWKSQMNRRTKLSIGVILLLGCVAGVMAVVVIVLSGSHGWNFVDTDDMNPAIFIDCIATIETQVAILCLCLAALKPLVNKWLDTTVKSTTHLSLQTIPVDERELEKDGAVAVEVRALSVGSR
ncbi:hypothetical protein K461DRAFT_175298 [Myriangium duriaei CBS 260.36]|uniref:Rhodopsin domain-containing protein n=1 Tax=Myriangium duriaei CBS 260.36 TaxID=1168546 RepID=A0A9P4J0U7_9PEZI|nr:hypothetical protein K461DRAFT_175298 [Myriangium duriaei CBS 260.36]